jgi:hypothetical protein
MEDTFDEKITQLGHEDVRLGKVADSDGQRTDVVVVAVRDDDGVEVLLSDERIERQT